MKIHVRLYGTLGNGFPDHDRLTGMAIEIPEGTVVGDLIAQLSIPRKKIGIISVDRIVVSDSRKLLPDNYVCMYQPIAGG